jgi:hypothetical protein
MICIIQAMYYPFLIAPETEIKWWQIGPLAGIGYCLGFPIFLLSECFSSKNYNEVLVWFFSLSWVVGIYLLIGIVIKKFITNKD